jgi:hypothetical protein
MSAYWKLEPEVAGSLGEGTSMDPSVHPPTIEKLQFIFEGWQGGALLEVYPCFLGTVGFAQSLRGLGCTGFRISHVDVREGYPLRELQPNVLLPALVWLQVTGEAGISDLGLSTDHSLVVSDRVLATLREHGLGDCDVAIFE